MTTVAPGDHITFDLDFTPGDFALYDTTQVQIWSNDPDETVLRCPSRARALKDGIFVDQFVQNVSTRVDVVWVLDNSGSMGGEVDNRPTPSTCSSARSLGSIWTTRSAWSPPT